MSSYSIDEIHNSNHNYYNDSHAVGDSHMVDYVALGWSISSYTQEADDGTVTVVPGQFLLLVGIAFLLGLGKGNIKIKTQNFGSTESPLSIAIFLLSLFRNKTLGLSLTFRFGLFFLSVPLLFCFGN